MRSRLLVAVTVAAGLFLAARAGAQSAPRFEVVSIKPSAAAFGPSHFNDAEGGHFAAVNVSLGQMVRIAYGVRPAGQEYSDLQANVPWLNGEHYDVRATTARQPSRAELLAMLRAMLAARFHLRVHTVPKEEPVLALRLARQDGRPGPGLRPSALVCGGPSEKCSLTNQPGRIAGTSVPMAGLTHMLSDWVEGHLEVRDETGLDGNFAIDLSWNADDLPLPTALQDQLGLKLVSAKASVPVLVIDSAERPVPD